MKTIANGLFAPTTSQAGFLNMPIEDAVAGLIAWRTKLRGRATSRKIAEPFPTSLNHLAPLTAGFGRELFVEIGEWTAYFNCHWFGTEAISPVSALVEILAVRGLAIKSRIKSSGTVSGVGRAVSFQLLSPVSTGSMNYERTIENANDDRHWTFILAGTEQPFEEPEAYTLHRTRDRFTSDMLERYCLALGIDLFNNESYGRSILVKSPARLVPGAPKLSLIDAQARLGVVPGAAAKVQG